MLRSAGTIASYARSVRAFCHWLVHNGYLEDMPIAHGTLPKEEKKPLCLIEPDVFDRLLLACRTGRDSDRAVERVAVRNRAILWVFLDTGMRVSELCSLRLGDVDREQRTLSVRAGGKKRSLPLSLNGWYQLLSYLERYRPKEVVSQGRGVEEDHLFLSEWSQPLSINAITLLFGRIRKQAGISDKLVSPSVLRDTFAVRYPQAGGTLEALRDRLGLRDLEALKRYMRAAQADDREGPAEVPAQVHLARREACSTNK